MTFAAGDRVTVRGERWVVQEATAFDDATLLDLSSADERATHRRVPPAFTRSTAPSRQAHSRNPRDDAAAVDASPACASIRTSRLRRAAGAAARRDRPPSVSARAGARARLADARSRFLLADEVGLGKTIQAGLMLAELRQRGWCEHALIVTPAGLRQQWADELLHRFEHSRGGHGCGVARGAHGFAAVRRESVDRRARRHYVDRLSQAARSASRACRTAVGRADCRRGASGDDRIPALRRGQRAGEPCAARHAPDRDPSCRRRSRVSSVVRDRRVSASDDPILLFRRTRELAGLPRSRRVHLLPVKPTPRRRRDAPPAGGIPRTTLDESRATRASAICSWSRWCWPSARSRARGRWRRRSSGEWLG